MQLNLPGEVEVAADTAQSWNQQSSPRVSRFPDEEVAGWSDYSVHGVLQISHAWPPADVTAALEEAKRARDKYRPGGSMQREFGPQAFRDIATTPLPGIAWNFGTTRYATFKVGQHVVRWTTSQPDGQAPSAMESRFRVIAQGLQARPVPSIPAGSGLCLPYVFIRDDGTSRRQVASTYRLKEHPDVTIMLRDTTAAKADPKANPRAYDPEAQSDSFWGLYDINHRKSLRSVWRDSYRRIKLGPSTGLESFVRIERSDGTEDHAYLAMARGDPDAKDDTPDLMLYVIQNSKNAKRKGMEPVSRDELLAIAQRVAASVKRRPAGQ